MKIGIVSPGGFDRSGEERVIPAFLWLVERLARRHEVHVFTLYQYPEPDLYLLKGATIHNIGLGEVPPPPPRRMLATLREIFGEHRRGRFDVLHGLWATETGLMAAVAGALLRVPSVVTVAGGELTWLPEIDYGAARSAKSRAMVGLTLRLAGAVTSAAEYTRRTLARVRPDTRLVTLGADTSVFRPPDSLPAGPPWRLLHVASLNRVKDQPTLLRAFQEIHAAEPEATLEIVGEDTLNGEIQRLAQSLGIGDAVTFHGFKTSAEVSVMMRRSHLLLHSSVFEDAGPLVFMEAAACAVPTVGTSVGILDDLAPTCAAAVTVGDHKALACAALFLLHDEECRRALGQSALAFARSHDADWTAGSFEALYQELVSAKRARGAQAARSANQGR